MMEGSDQEGGSSVASMEETSANGELSVMQTLGHFGWITVVFDRPAMLSALLYMSGGLFQMFIFMMLY